MALQPPDIFKTGRLHLRRPRADDAPAIFSEYVQDRDVTKYLTWKPHERCSDTETFLTWCLARWDAGEEYSWVITLASEDRAIGMLSCRIAGWKAELGYVLARRFWNHGYMSEAVSAVVDWAIAAEGIFRVWAYCDVDNPQSARVLEKVGMQREGILRRWMILPNVSSEPRDCLVYSRVRGHSPSS
jgi:[ribosomal protein S5]-alanine N-acetyltransferase